MGHVKIEKFCGILKIHMQFELYFLYSLQSKHQQQQQQHPERSVINQVTGPCYAIVSEWGVLR